MQKTFGIKSMVLGVAAGITTVLSFGAMAHRTALEEFAPLRFRVVGIAPQGDVVRGKQIAVLRVAPHYGKIDTRSRQFRMKHDTQDLTFVTSLNAGYDIRSNDIINVEVTEHIKIGR